MTAGPEVCMFLYRCAAIGVWVVLLLGAEIILVLPEIRLTGRLHLCIRALWRAIYPGEYTTLAVHQQTAL